MGGESMTDSSGRAEPDVTAVRAAIGGLDDALQAGYVGWERMKEHAQQAAIAACEAYAQQFRIAGEITTELLHTAEAERDEAQRDARALAEALRVMLHWWAEVLVAQGDAAYIDALNAGADALAAHDARETA